MLLRGARSHRKNIANDHLNLQRNVTLFLEILDTLTGSLSNVYETSKGDRENINQGGPKSGNKIIFSRAILDFNLFILSVTTYRGS